MSTYLSNKLRAISFLSIVLVVILHSQLLVYSKGNSFHLQQFLTSEVTRISVPFFFYISGFLLFYNCKTLNYSWYCSKLKKRVRSLLVPFLIWSISGFTIVYSIKFILPSAFNSYQGLEKYQLVDFLQALLWNPVGCYQLWFVRDLFLCVSISPILYGGLKILKELFLLLFFLLWFFDIQYVISIESVLFVTIGAYMALNHKTLAEKVNSEGSVLLQGILWIVFCVWDYSCPFYNIIHGMGLLLGMSFVWGLYDVVYVRTLGRFSNCKVYRYTFFIFVFHEPILTLIKGILLKLAMSQTGILLIYFSAPILVVGICLICARRLKKYFPLVYRIICGGRSQ